MKKKLLLFFFVLSLVVVFFSLGATAAQPDFENHWAKLHIEFLHEKGIITEGELQGFQPDELINRAELAVWINQAMGFTNYQGGKNFSDVKSGDRFEKAVSIAAAQGYLLGVGGNRIEPQGKVSREQAAVIIARIMDLTPSDSNFKDKDQISAWAKDFVGAVDQKGYMMGNNGFFRPTAPLTKGEAAAILSRMLKKGAKPALLYDLAYVQSQMGGFTDTVTEYAQEEGLTVEAFKKLCEKSAADMTSDELAKMNRIRAKQMKPTPDTLMQKVITTYDMNKYLSGAYKTPKGFISICADVKQYENVQDYYYGLRLDYEGTYFKPDEESYAVIRFKAANIEKAIIPRSVLNQGTFSDPYPFGGVGFTTGTNGRWGSPEWVMPEFTVLDDGAQLFEIFQDGTEVLKAIYRGEAGRFLPVE